MAPVEKENLGYRISASVAGVLLASVIGLFVWFSNLDKRVAVLEESRFIERQAQLRVEEANKESIARIEHEREANDARVRDDLRELRSRVFK